VTRRARRTGKLLLLLASLVFSFILAELGSRLIGPVDYRRPHPRMPDNAWRELVHQRSEIPGLAYELAPNVRKHARSTLIRTNSAGMRDRELSLEKSDSTVRMAVLGDSVTFGFVATPRATKRWSYGTRWAGGSRTSSSPATS
jgi:hypothetical protein